MTLYLGTPSASFFHQDLSDIKHQINKRKKKKNYTQQQIEKLGRNEPGCKHISLTQKDLTEKEKELFEELKKIRN